MKLLIAILNEPSLLSKVLENLELHNINGGTILESKGMVNELLRNEEFAFFGTLRKIVTKEHAKNLTLLFALDDDLVDIAIKSIEEIVGSFEQPDTGIAIVLPIDFVKGIRF